MSYHYQAPTTPIRRPAGRSAAITPVKSVDGFSTPNRGRGHHLRRSSAATRSPTSVVKAFDHRRVPPSPSQWARAPPARSLPRRSDGFATGVGPNNICSVLGGGGIAPPMPNGKYKTEMCKNIMTQGYCRFGANCHYAHSEVERHSTSVEDLMKDDRLLFPCFIMVSTGFCPYGHRCKNLHDPKITANDKTNGDHVIVLEHCVKDKKHGFTIPDRLYHHQLNSIRQTNPLIAPCIWENCRPPATGASARIPSTKNSGESEQNSEWMDTYNLICNSGRTPGATANAFMNVVASPPRKRRTGGGFRYSDIINKNNNPRVALGELQKLCIAITMRDADGAHLDFTYASTDCMNDQPCMVLQSRYFRLLDFANRREQKKVTIFMGDIISEISLEVYHAGKSSNSSEAFVSAREVAFDSKGKRACNLSIWFDTKITPCSITKVKKVSKMADPWHIDHETTSLFCMPNNEEFEKSFPSHAHTRPYVFMQPIDDLRVGHDLIKAILQHRVATILRTRGFCIQIKLPVPLDRLRNNFARMKRDLERWAWSKTSDVSHFSKTTELRNRAAYSPSNTNGGMENAVPAVWKSFAANLNAREDSAFTIDVPEKRLAVFRSIVEKTESSGVNAIPHIKRFLTQTTSSKTTLLSRVSHAEATWRELILGEGGQDGLPWKKAIESHTTNIKRNAVRSSSAAERCKNTYDRYGFI